jgi:riboflavin kinase / FMN adenylyltransferase
MQIITDLKRATFPKKPCAVTIGNFDGLHLGHIALLQQMRSLLPKEGIITVYTFTNHPSHVLSHLPPIPFIYTLDHKLKLLEEIGVDYTILSPFTKQFAQTPYQEFLFALKKACHFSLLVVGKGATFGKNKEGDEKAIQNLANAWHFHAKYLPKIEIDGQLLSSGHIRSLIASAQLSSLKHSLGRAYSIYAPLLKKGSSYHLDIQQLCLPPSGSYPVEVRLPSKAVYVAEAHIDRHNQIVRLVFNASSALTEASLAEVVFI